MKQVFKHLRLVIDRIFEDDLAVMSLEVREILSHKEDAKKYTDAVNSKERPLTVTFHNGNSLTLI